MLFYKRLLPDYLQMPFLRKLKIVSLWTLKFGLKLPYFMVNSLKELGPRVGLLTCCDWDFSSYLRHWDFCWSVKERQPEGSMGTLMSQMSKSRWESPQQGKKRRGSQAPAFLLPSTTWCPTHNEQHRSNNIRVFLFKSGISLCLRRGMACVSQVKTDPPLFTQVKRDHPCSLRWTQTLPCFSVSPKTFAKPEVWSAVQPRKAYCFHSPTLQLRQTFCSLVPVSVGTGLWRTPCLTQGILSSSQSSPRLSLSRVLVLIGAPSSSPPHLPLSTPSPSSPSQGECGPKLFPPNS